MAPSVAELSLPELSNFAHSVTIHETPRDWAEMYYPTAIDTSPAALARFQTKFVTA